MVFHKGGENSYFIFQLVFCLPLISTPTLYVENWFYFGIICSKWQIFTIGIKILFTFNWYLLIYFFQLVSMKIFIGILKFDLLRYLKICFIEKIQNCVLIRNVKNVLIWLHICKGSLTSLLHIDSCWVYLILRSLTTLLYAIHVCRESFTSLLMHCIFCVMWIRASHPFFM